MIWLHVFIINLFFLFQWCRRDQKWNAGINQDTFTAHVNFASYIAADQFLADIFLCSSWPWTLIIAHINSIMDPGVYDMIIRLLIMDRTFVIEPSIKWVDFVDQRLLDASLVVLENIPKKACKRKFTLISNAFMFFNEEQPAAMTKWFETPNVRTRIMKAAVRYAINNEINSSILKNLWIRNISWAHAALDYANESTCKFIKKAMCDAAAYHFGCR